VYNLIFQVLNYAIDMKPKDVTKITVQ